LRKPPLAHSLDDAYLIEGPKWARDLVRPRRFSILIPLALIAILIGVTVALWDYSDGSTDQSPAGYYSD
jgi:hypothetical protein